MPVARVPVLRVAVHVAVVTPPCAAVIVTGCPPGTGPVAPETVTPTGAGEPWVAGASEVSAVDVDTATTTRPVGVDVVATYPASPPALPAPCRVAVTAYVPTVSVPGNEQVA